MYMFSGTRPFTSLAAAPGRCGHLSSSEPWTECTQNTHQWTGEKFSFSMMHIWRILTEPKKSPLTEGVRSLLPGEEKAWGKRMTDCQYWKDGYREDGGSLFTRSHTEKTRGNRYKLHWERFHRNVRKKFLTVRSIIHWNKLLRDGVASLYVGVFKMQLDRVVGNLLQCPFPMNSWTRRSFDVPYNLGCFLSPWF